MKAFLLLVMIIGLVGGVVFLGNRIEGSPPEVGAPESILLGAKGGTIALELVDAGSGLRSVTAVLAHADGEETLVTEQWPGKTLSGGTHGRTPISLDLEIDGMRLPPKLKDARLRIDVRDWSLAGMFAGNQVLLDIPVTIDRKPPRVSVANGLSYVKRGGAGVVVYSLSEETVRDGVEVGDAFYPGYPLEGGNQRVAFYAVAAEAPSNVEPRVIANDAAGNTGRAEWPIVVKDRTMPSASVTLPSSFLHNVLEGLATAEGIDTTDLEAAFDEVNTKTRAQNEATIRNAISDTASTQLWDGSFLQLPNSKVTSRFAEKRTYFVANKSVSKATHFGYDLASTRAAPIIAANAGRVVHADELGIYGNCVLLDHGQGVSSLYGHLSRIDVAVGDEVDRGQSVGLSGATGLAGGDHLHFAVLVGGTYVDPIEWWDAKWITDNIDKHLPSPRP